MTKFFFDIFNLLLQEVFALLLVKIHARLLLNILLEFQQLDFSFEGFQQAECTLSDVIFLKQFNFVFDGERQIAANIVDANHAVPDTRKSILCFVGHLVVETDIIAGTLLHSFIERIELFVEGGHLVGIGHHFAQIELFPFVERSQMATS